MENGNIRAVWKGKDASHRSEIGKFSMWVAGESNCRIRYV